MLAAERDVGERPGVESRAELIYSIRQAQNRINPRRSLASGYDSSRSGEIPRDLVPDVGIECPVQGD